MNQKKFDKDTCWYIQEQALVHMNRAYDGYLSIMDETKHIQTLKEIVACLPPGQKVIDIGCGSAMISLLFKNHTYIGADLKFMIDGIAKVKHPENSYIEFDAETTDWSFVESADVILLNAFIDVMQFPIEVLNQILSKSKKYVIIHRQELSLGKPTQLISNGSYGGKTFHSIINMNDFSQLHSSHGFYMEKLLPCGFSNWEGDGSSILLRHQSVKQKK